jgi:SNF2 family DNA or RNA helicase
MESLFKTTPFRHQLEEWERSRELATRAIFWEQGTGKTWLALNTAAHLFRTGQIDAMLVIAPNGVHENWITDEIPAHMPEDVRTTAFAYVSKKAKTKAHARAVEEVLASPGLAFLAMSYNAFMTYEGRRVAEKLLAKRKVFFVLDESQRIKNPGAKRTISIVAAGRRATFKRILSGTPITNKPFDVYPQCKFLDEEFWKKRDFASFEPFKTYFGVWEQRVNGSTGQRFNQVVAFRNLDHLGRIVAEIASRVTKEEVLDLPPKTYQKRYFDLSEEQARRYREIRDEFMTFLESGEMVTAPLVVTRLLRLQQITCGYLPSDDCEHMTAFQENPRLSALLEILEDLEGSAIIFARFRKDVDQICAALGADAVRYDGAVDGEGRLEARTGFQRGDVRFFVGNPAVAGTGLTLHRASTVVYYSNSFDLEQRLQSEDRAHRIGQAKAVTYIDLIAKGTVDAKIVRALREKLDIASQIVGDKAREWV